MGKLRRRQRTFTIVVSCVVVLALAIAITLGLVLGPLLKRDDPKKPTIPTLNVLNYYKNENVDTIGKFTEQSFSQDIVTDDNHKQNFSIDGRNMNCYVYNYRVSNIANNLESIEIKAENSNLFKDINSLLVRGNYSSYSDLASALEADNSIEQAYPNGDSAEYTLTLSKSAEKAEISYCFIVASQSDIADNFKLTTSLKIKDGEIFEKDSVLLSSVDMQTGFNSTSKQEFNETNLVYNFVSKDGNIVYQFTDGDDTQYYYLYNYSISNTKDFSNIVIRVKDKTNFCAGITLVTGNYVGYTDAMSAIQDVSIKKSSIENSTMLPLNLINAKKQNEMKFSLLLMVTQKISDDITIEIKANRESAKPLQEHIGYDYRYDISTETNGDKRVAFARMVAGDKKSNVFDNYVLNGVLNYSVEVKDDISNIKIDFTDENTMLESAYHVLGSPTLFMQVYYLINLYSSYGFVPIPQTSDSYMLNTGDDGIAVEVTQNNWLDCWMTVDSSKLSEENIAQIKEHCIEVVDNKCIVPLCNDYIASNSSSDAVLLYAIYYLFLTPSDFDKYADEGYAYTEASLAQGMVSLFANATYNFLADGGEPTEIAKNLGIDKSASLEDLFVKLLKYYLTCEKFDIEDIIGKDSSILTREYRSIYIVPGDTYSQEINGLVFDKDYSAKTLKVDVDVNDFVINVWNANTIISNNDSAYVDNNALINSTTKEMIRYSVENGATNYSVPQGVKLIGKYALFNCKNVKNLTIDVDGLTEFDETSLKHTKIDKLYASSLYLSNNSFDIMLKNSDIQNIEAIGKNGTTWEDVNQFMVIANKNVVVKYSNNICGLTFELGQNGYIVSGASDNTISRIYVPETYNNKNVVGIKTGAFKNFANLEEVILPTTLKIIGDNAFEGCTKLKMLTLDNISLDYFGAGNILPTMVVTSNVSETLNKIKSSSINNISVDLDFNIGRSNIGNQGNKEMNPTGTQNVVYKLTIGQATYTFSYNYDNTLEYTRQIIFNQGPDDVSANVYAYINALPLIGIGESNHTLGIDHIQEQIALQRVADNTKIVGTSTDETYYNHSTVPVTVEYSTTDTSKIKSGDVLKLIIKFDIMESVQCFTGETLVTLADGSTKQIKDVTYDDLLMVYDFDRGEFSASYPIWIAKVGEYNHYYKMTFSDGSYVNIVLSHRLFTLTDMDFEKSIDATYSSVGKEFVKQILDENGQPKFVSVTCTNIERIDEIIKYYNMVTSQSLNFFSNGFMGATGIANLYHFEKNEKGNIVHKQSEIEKCKSGTTDWKTGTQFAYDVYDKDRITEEVYTAYRLSEIRNMAYCWINDPSSPYYQIAQKYGKDVVYKKAIEAVNDYFKDGYIESLRSTKEQLKITFSDRTYSKKINYKDVITLPQASVGQNFVGWYNTYDGKIYQPGEGVEIHMNTHFIARYSI